MQRVPAIWIFFIKNTIKCYFYIYLLPLTETKWNTRMKNASFEIEFKHLYKKYFGSFCLYANRYIKDMDISKDIVSDVFASFWQDRERVGLKKETILAYIKTCVKNRAFNYLKHQKYEWEHVEYTLNQPHSYADSPDKVYHIDELYALLNATLNKLPPEYKAVFIKSVIQQKPHAEIAEELNISLRSVNRYKQKVLGELRLELKDYLPLVIAAGIALYA